MTNKEKLRAQLLSQQIISIMENFAMPERCCPDKLFSRGYWLEIIFYFQFYVKDGWMHRIFQKYKKFSKEDKEKIEWLNKILKQNSLTNKENDSLAINVRAFIIHLYSKKKNEIDNVEKNVEKEILRKMLVD